MIKKSKITVQVAREFLRRTDKLYETFIKIYYPDYDYSDCYAIGRGSSWMTSIPWPLDIGEGGYRYDLNDVFVALYNDIPRDIVLERYDKHVEEYDNKKTYRKVNLYSYRRMNYDKEKYYKEKADDLENSRQRMLEASYTLDEEMKLEKGTFYKTYLSITNKTDE